MQGKIRYAEKSAFYPGRIFRLSDPTGKHRRSLEHERVLRAEIIRTFFSGFLCFTTGIGRFQQRWKRFGFLTTGKGTGLSRPDRTGMAGLPVTGRSEIYSRTAFVSR
jgi:hypothetical protein